MCARTRVVKVGDHNRLRVRARVCARCESAAVATLTFDRNLGRARGVNFLTLVSPAARAFARQTRARTG